VGIAGLQRAARLAGEAFGHEDVIGTPAAAEMLSARLIWWLAAIAAASGLAILHFS
jgi:predicted cobalt transporter CbtA